MKSCPNAKKDLYKISDGPDLGLFRITIFPINLTLQMEYFFGDKVRGTPGFRPGLHIGLIDFLTKVCLATVLFILTWSLSAAYHSFVMGSL